MDNLITDKVLKTLLDNVNSCIFILNDEIRVKQVNPSFESFFNTTMASIHNYLCGNAISCSNAVEEGVLCGHSSRCGECELRSTLTEALRNPDSSIKKAISLDISANGKREKKYFRLSVSPMLNNDEKSLVVVMEDFTDLKEAHIALERLAKTDGLTGVANHRTVMEELDRLCSNDGELSVIMVDLDHFKRVNDTWGHKRGDLVLVATAANLEKVADQEAGSLVGRYGGEEFLVLLPGADKDKVTSVAESMRARIEATTYDPIDIHCTASFGVATFKDQTPTDLIIQADDALYRAKETGRNKVCGGE